MGKLKAVENRNNFVEMENEILKWWYESEIDKKFFEKNRGSDKHFSFIDGPITANNPMGVHHAWGRAYKDFVSRYKAMKGFDQRYQMGFDCQGLWVEVEVEKALGFNSKKDILDFGIGNFTNACKERVNKYADIQTEQSKRLGMFMDWENSYYTMSETNNLYIWKFLKKCKEMDLLYKSHSATTWCPRCETGLSQHEQADGYKDVEDTSVYVKFRIKGKKDEYILAWTTTPWTLSANVLLAVNPTFEYVKVVDGKDTLYLAKIPAERLGFKMMEKVEVSTILAFEYESLYDIEAQKSVTHKVVEWDLVTEDSGTGVVHIAPGCGQEDYELGLTLNAPAISPLDESGHFISGYGELSGMYAHDVKDVVLEYLKKEGLLFKTEQYNHSYPHCWRCKTKCLFRLENNWFINISKIREQLKEEAQKADWIPDYAGKRMQDWLRNMGDWMISRKRFYGLSLPFYECECGEITVLGSKDELKKLAADSKKVDELPSLHRPWIDEIKIKCPKCGKEVNRISDVGDCWLDAGVVGFSTLKYDEDKEYWKKWYPADFVSEMLEQVRLWFYSLLVFGVVLEGTIPYKKVLTYAEMRDDNNERMSKTKKNYIPFDEAANKVGSDIIRWTFAQNPFTKNIRFGWSTIEEVNRQFLLPFWNTYTYFVMYALAHNWEYDSKFDPEKCNDVMDQWVISSLHKLIVEVNEDMDEYKFPSVSSKVGTFVLDLSTWFIRRSRDRFKDGDKEALNTLYYVLINLTKLLAPFMPFISEFMYKNLGINVLGKDAKESVHLEAYPEGGKFDEKLISNMKVVRELATIGLNIRDTSKIKLRQPLSKAYGNLEDPKLIEILKSELNVKDFEYSKTHVEGKDLVSLSSNGLFVTLNTAISAELAQEGMYRDLVRKIQDQRKKEGFKVGDRVAVVIYSSDKMTKEAVEKYDEQLRSDVGATKLEVRDGDELKIELTK